MARAGKRAQSAVKSTPRAGPRDVALRAIPEVYREMLADAASSSPTGLDEDGRTPKRRRVGGRVVIQQAQDTLPIQPSAASETAGDTGGDSEAGTLLKAQQQTAYDDSADSVESDPAWEEVDLRDGWKGEGSTLEPQELNLVLGGKENSATKQPSQRRKPVTSEERKLRLEIHKMHLLSLLAHVHLRNHWCNDTETQETLRKLLPKKTLSYLDDDETQSQFQRSGSCMDGLKQASDVFRSRFKITARGMSRSYWAEGAGHLTESGIPNDIDLPTQKSDFRTSAATLRASRDIGAQLFCALLRSAGVEARLVCSLQPLPFTATAKGATPVKPKPAFTISYADTRLGISDEESGADARSDASIRTTTSSNTNGSVNRIRSKLNTRLGRTQTVGSDSTTYTAPQQQPGQLITSLHMLAAKRKPIRESPYPVYWVEAFNAAVQKWVPVDPLVTKSVSKPSKFEPPASDIENKMTYVIAFEDDGSARDVTRRYAKAYNAKTRKGRVEVTKGGEKWWRRVLRIYQRVFDQDRDQIEDTEMTRKEEQEGMPRNVQDFKNHPYYALERHLRRHEVIHPKREVGKVTVGKSSADNSKALEPVYRHRDVHMVKSANSWYRLGREIKTGEQPLKRVQPRRKREVVSEEDISEDEGDSGTPMYAAFQTQTYVPPSVVRGIIPKNTYGNLDVYVPSMVPPGGVHMLHPDTARAARLIGVDYADAVTGFEFKGRFGTAVVRGAVVAREYQEAVGEVIQGFEYERAEAEENRRSLEALRMWRRFLAGLRIRQRIEGYEIEGEKDVIREEMQHVDEEMEEDEGGGFLPDRGPDGIAEPTAGRTFESLCDYDYEEGGGFMDEDSDGGDHQAEDETEEPAIHSVPFISGFDEDLRGGGFLEDEVDDSGAEDEDAEEASRDVGDEGHKEAAAREAPQALTPFEEDKITDFDHQLNSDGEILSHAQDLDNDLAGYELEDARMLQQVYESQSQDAAIGSNTGRERNQEESSTEVPITSEQDLTQEASKTVDEAQDNYFPEIAGADTPYKADSEAVHIQQPDNTDTPEPGSEIEKGSLLSEDPSDEDAEPEWISQF